MTLGEVQGRGIDGSYRSRRYLKVCALPGRSCKGRTPDSGFDIQIKFRIFCAAFQP